MKELDNSFTDIIHCYTHTPIINTALSDYLPTGFYDLHQYRLGFCVLLRAGMLCSSHTQNGHGSLKENLIHMKSQVYSGHMYKKAKTTQKDRRVKRERQIETGSTFFPACSSLMLT